MKTKIRERRRKMLTQIGRGIPLKTVVSDLTKEYNITKHGLYVDWARRDGWVDEIVGTNRKALATMLVHNLQQVIPNLWREYLTAPDSRARIHALKAVVETNYRMFEMLQTCGTIEKAPEKYEIKWKEE